MTTPHEAAPYRRPAVVSGPRVSRRLLLRRALGATTVVWLPSWIGCDDDAGGPVGGGRDATSEPLDAASSVDAGSPHDAGSDAAIDAAQVTPPDAGVFTFDDCEPLLTPTSSFFVSNGGDGTRAGWELPDLTADDYRLTFEGELARPRSFSLSELAALPQVTVLDTLQCLFGQRGTGLFRGVPVRALLERVELDRERALRLRFHGADGFGNNLRVQDVFSDASATMRLPEPLIALALNGEPLPRANGFPARLLVPGRAGFKNVKWLTRIEATASDEPFGDYQAIGLATDASVIPPNTAYRGQHRVRAGASGRVTLCGQSQSGSGAIVEVEISIDGADYTSARIVPLAQLLAAEPRLREAEQVRLGLPWPFVGVAVPWEYDFVATPGEHVVRIRVVDDSGASSDSRVPVVFDDEQDAG